MTLPVGRRSIPNTAPCIKSLRIAAQPATNLVQGAFLLDRNRYVEDRWRRWAIIKDAR